MIGPNDFRLTVSEERKNFGRFVVEPLARGYGQTLGNSLRRVLLSSLKGAAITEVHLAGVSHQFSTIEGVREDVVEITLNLKKVRLRIEGEEPVALKLLAEGKGEVRAGDIEVPAGVEVINKDLVLATLTTDKAKLEAELLAEPGVGFVPSEERTASRVGVIVLDAIFTPVLRVSYRVEPTRFGQVTNLDKLILELETDGTIGPKEAFLKASEILMRYFYQLAQGEQEPQNVEERVEKPKMSEEEKGHPLEDLELQTRVTNNLKKGGIKTCGDLIAIIEKHGYEELMKIPNVGEKSVEEIKKKVAERGWE